MLKVLSAAAFLLSTTAAAACPLPDLAGHPVVDGASMLSLDEENQLESALAAVNGARGHQVAVVTLPSLQGDSVEQCANAILRKWRLGDAKRDDGVLLLAAKQEHKLRIEVGYGLEGDLTDLQAATIIRQTIAPRLKQGKTAEGLLAGVQAIGSAINTVPPAAAQAPAAPRQSKDNGGALWFILGLAGVGGGAWLWLSSRARARRRKQQLEQLELDRQIARQRACQDQERKAEPSWRAAASPSSAPTTAKPAAPKPVAAPPPPSHSRSTDYDSGSYSSGSSWSSSSSSSDSGSSFSGGGGDSGGGGASGDW